jgi:HSP20 family protein
MTMALRDLVPWNNGSRNVSTYRGEGSPFLALHREMNRLFDEAFRSFDLASFGSTQMADHMGWPSVDVSETATEVKVTADLPGLEQKDVSVELSGGMLTISGEKKRETEDKERRFSERFYGRFERVIPVEDIETDKVDASFRNGVLTVTLPKSPTAKDKVKKIPIKG